MRRALQILLLSLALAGCSVLTRATPIEVRYFTPEPARALAHTTSSREPDSRPRLQLGDLSSSVNLRDRIVHRESPVEVGVYETLRWTEHPEQYVRRSLTRALFEDRPIEHVFESSAPALDVELLSFEVLHDDHRWAGRVQLRYRLRDERTVIASGVVTMEQPATERGFDGAVAAVGVAMNAATDKLASEIATRLRKPLGDNENR